MKTATLMEMALVTMRIPIVTVMALKTTMTPSPTIRANTDTDGDGIGDAADNDDDGDGVSDTDDAFRSTQMIALIVTATVLVSTRIPTTLAMVYLMQRMISR